MEGIGSYISVIGLSSLSTDLVILLLAIVLDIAKIVSVSLLYKFWDKLNALTKVYLIPAVVVTVIITSAGAYGYLRETFQKAVLPNQDVQLQITSLEQRHVQIEQRLSAIDSRKIQIDEQIAKIPDTSVRGRKQLIAAFDPEKKQLVSERVELSKELTDVDKKIPELKSKGASTDNHIGGPVVAVAETFDISKESAIKIVAGVIVAVFDPLAIVLLLCGNQAMRIAFDNKRKAPVEKIKKELEEAKWLHEAEKQRIGYQHELDLLKEEPVELIEEPKIQELPQPIVLDEVPQFKELVEESPQIETIKPKQRRNKRVVPELPESKKKLFAGIEKLPLDEPKPIVIDEKDLMDVLSGIVSGFDSEEVAAMRKSQQPATLSEYNIVDVKTTSDDVEQQVISGNIMEAIHLPDHFADHSKDAHEDNVNFYKSNLPPQ
jgi:hypothetical protein